jgi:hypothetical protein
MQDAVGEKAFLQSPGVFGVWVCAEDFVIGGVERVFFVEGGDVDGAGSGGVGVWDGVVRWRGACDKVGTWGSGGMSCAEGHVGVGVD